MGGTPGKHSVLPSGLIETEGKKGDVTSMRRVITSLECFDVDEKLEFPCQQGVWNNFYCRCQK